MGPTVATAEARESGLLEAARRGSEDAYAELVEGYRAELEAFRSQAVPLPGQ
jgi:hypothetical protein